MQSAWIDPQTGAAGGSVRSAETEARRALRGLHARWGWVPRGSCDGVLLELGVSSPHLDQAVRGFSFMQDGPLDMRMDTRQDLTAADLLNTAGVDELAKIFWELADERDSRRFARAM